MRDAAAEKERKTHALSLTAARDGEERARGEAAAARDALSSTAAEGADGLKAVRAALALREREVEHSRREAGPCRRLSLHLALSNTPLWFQIIVLSGIKLDDLTHIEHLCEAMAGGGGRGAVRRRARVQGKATIHMNNARHVIHRIANPRPLTFTSSYDVAMSGPHTRWPTWRIRWSSWRGGWRRQRRQRRRRR